MRQSKSDPGSWTEFVGIYGPRIRHWCRGWGLQQSDAEDVTQNVMLAMARQMRSFEYDSSLRFRSWLKTIAFRAWVDFLKSRNRAVAGSGSDAVQAILASVKTKEDFVDQIMEECDKGILEDAMLIVRRRVNENTWQAFQMTAINGISAQHVATQLEMAITAVYKAKSRIQRLLKEEIERIDQSF
ncbi:RNA polymerase sigma factor [bacterium]|nr:RNA polymerase sigma factor [bacterium]